MAEGLGYCGPVKTSHKVFIYIIKVDEILSVRTVYCSEEYSNSYW